MTVFKEPGALRKIVVRAVAVTALIEVYVNLVVFPLPVELVLVPGLTMLTLITAAAGTNPDYALLKTLLDWLLGAIGTALLIYVTVHLATHASELAPADIGRRFGLPIWLTFGLLPFIAALAVYAHYDSAFSMIRWACPESDRRRRAYSALLTGLHLRASQVARFNGLWAKQVVAAESLSEARTVVAAFRESGGRQLPGTPM